MYMYLEIVKYECSILPNTHTHTQCSCTIFNPMQQIIFEQSVYGDSSKYLHASTFFIWTEYHAKKFCILMCPCIFLFSQ